MGLEIVSMRSGHAADAAKLVVAEYHRLRAQVPALPARYEDANVIVPMIEQAISRAPAVAAISGSELVGFLSGFLVKALWGKRGIFCPEWANAAVSGQARELYEKMYAHLAREWIANGCFTHAIGMLASARDAIDALHWLGFGYVSGDAVRDLGHVRGHVSGEEVRLAEQDDLDDVLVLAEALGRYMAAPPTFLAFARPPDRDAYAEWIADPDRCILLACLGGEAVGYMRFGPASSDACDIIVDPGTCSNTGAFVFEEARGCGLGAALLRCGLEWAREHGYERCAVDFESANVLASRFWTRHFRPVVYGLARRIDERIAWAHGQRDLSQMW